MKKRVAVIGGGPVGIEAGLLFAQRGFDVIVFEAGAVGEHVDRWAHVRFFSPWALNRSPWGEAELRERGIELGPGDDFPTGAEYMRSYLRPLADSDALAGRVRVATKVLGVTRRDVWKGDLIGNSERDAGPFLLAVEGPHGGEWVEADVVFDATGTYGTPSGLGPGGLAALGEEEVEDLIERWIPEPQERDRDLYAGKVTLLIGEGHSAATSMKLLSDLRETDPDSRLLWLRRTETPYEVLEDDVLPERRELAELGNAAAAGQVEGIEPLGIGRVVKFFRRGEQAGVRWESPSGEQREVVVDRVVSNVGYRPDTEMTRELQVHHCYASEGPMKLAASLLAQSGNSDCLAQVAAGVDTLRNPEPNFFVVGSKSYGRNSNFLLRVGFEQLEAIADTLEA